MLAFLAIISLNFFLGSLPFWLLHAFFHLSQHHPAIRRKVLVMDSTTIHMELRYSLQHSIESIFCTYVCYVCHIWWDHEYGILSVDMNVLERHKSSNQLIIVYTRRKIVDIKVSAAQTVWLKPKANRPNTIASLNVMDTCHTKTIHDEQDARRRGKKKIMQSKYIRIEFCAVR